MSWEEHLEKVARGLLYNPIYPPDFKWNMVVNISPRLSFLSPFLYALKCAYYIKRIIILKKWMLPSLCFVLDSNSRSLFIYKRLKCQREMEAQGTTTNIYTFQNTEWEKSYIYIYTHSLHADFKAQIGRLQCFKVGPKIKHCLKNVT